MTARRASVNAFGSSASGAGTAGVAIPRKSTEPLLQGLELGCPVGRPRQVRHLRGEAVEAPGAVVREVAGLRRRRLDLGALPPLVEARDGDAVRPGAERRAPEVVVRLPVVSGARQGVLTGADAVVARPDARLAQEAARMRLLAQ